MTLNVSAHFFNSFNQLYNIVAGPIIKNGPDFLYSYYKQFKKEMVYIVFPKPISSAKITLFSDS